MSETVYRQIVADIAAAQTGPKSEIAAELIGHVHAGLAASEPWAIEVAQRWEIEGAARDYSNAHKALHSVTYIRRDGRRVRKTTSYSRPLRSPESGDVVGMQMQTWWGWSRSEVEASFADIQSQEDRLGEVKDAHRQILDAMDRHPQCDTARDAWVADGRALTEIDLSA